VDHGLFTAHPVSLSIGISPSAATSADSPFFVKVGYFRAKVAGLSPGHSTLQHL
jgi:hypothetical protein